ncbi:signal recognition particle subunit SRP19 [Pancytospora epiphaga]|nr:signal recognition particle subunit SRP19 [Pancytospora epiphaga]
MDSRHFILYPAYIDSKKTRKEGRKYPISCGVSSPKYQEIKCALDRLKIEHTAEPSKLYPRDQTVLGRFTIQKKGEKIEMVARLICEITEERARRNNSRSGVPNLLNLVPIRKKKGKKANK